MHFKQLNPRLDLICRQMKFFQKDFSFCINNQTKISEVIVWYAVAIRIYADGWMIRLEDTYESSWKLSGYLTVIVVLCGMTPRSLLRAMNLRLETWVFEFRDKQLQWFQRSFVLIRDWMTIASKKWISWTL